jgi:hypothetical protein
MQSIGRGKSIPTDVGTACMVEEEGAQDVCWTFFLFLLPSVFFLFLHESSISASASFGG